ncbi:signal peptidase I [Anaeromicropila herbilytica]|uniref:Signal peptidase I n=1 Tax=Anaeromicropila herbilytica TaxID=2785025 RepID=A0A7R7EM74_9FIRM|nr:signal peptidase I [Anaeromicropila herbilytica]BCN31319.1 signal peptidase I [Anaeromicropila herbilytica]
MKSSYESFDKKPIFKRILKEIAVWAVEIVIVIGIAFLTIHFGVEKVTVVGKSMENALMPADTIIVNKLAYKITKPKRYDVIVFDQSGKEHSYYNIKRVIGLPGETVQIKNGLVYIDGKKLKEEVKVKSIKDGGIADDKITLDEDEFFVLGDNRNNSEDSRYANIGNVISDEIVGKAILRVNKFSIISQLNKK